MSFSPWLRVSSHDQADYEASRNAKTDVLIGPLLQWGADAYRPEAPSAGVESYISPLHHPFKTSIPILLHGGGGEAFCDDIKEFGKEMADKWPRSNDGCHYTPCYARPSYWL